MSETNIVIAYKDVTTQITPGGSKLLNNYKSQTHTAQSFVCTTTAVSGPLVVVAYLPSETGSVTMTVNGVATTETTPASNAGVGYGSGKYIAVYLSATSATTFNVSFNKTVTVSKIFISPYWQPQYNASFGVAAGVTDLSTSERLQSGDLYTTRGPISKTLSFNLEYITPLEKINVFNILTLVGKHTPLFVSVFPKNSADKSQEQIYSVYGCLQSTSNLTYRLFTVYSATFEITEF